MGTDTLVAVEMVSGICGATGGGKEENEGNCGSMMDSVLPL